MRDLDEEKINNAVHECLDRCYRTDDSLPKIAEFLAELKASGDWSKAEIRAVELAVHAVMHGIVDCDIDSENAMDESSDDEVLEAPNASNSNLRMWLIM